MSKLIIFGLWVGFALLAVASASEQQGLETEAETRDKRQAGAFWLVTGGFGGSSSDNDYRKKRGSFDYLYDSSGSNYVDGYGSGDFRKKRGSYDYLYDNSGSMYVDGYGSNDFRKKRGSFDYLYDSSGSNYVDGYGSGDFRKKRGLFHHDDYLLDHVHSQYMPKVTWDDDDFKPDRKNKKNQ